MRNESIVGVGMITDSWVVEADVGGGGGSGDTMKLCRAVVAEPPKPTPTPSESAAIRHGNIV
jgi:hypothetical protein